MCRNIVCLVCAHPLQEVACPTLFEETHQRRAESLASIRGNLGNGGLSASPLLDVASSNLLELKVLCDVGGNEDVGEFAVGHQELGDKVDVPIVDAAVLLPRLAGGLAILLEESLDVEGSRLTVSC